jgi:hypothetical protein
MPTSAVCSMSSKGFINYMLVSRPRLERGTTTLKV